VTEFEFGANRVIFAPGSISRIGEEVARIGCSRAMLISTPGRTALVDKANDILGTVVVENFNRAVVHVPEDIAAAAVGAANASHADVLIALGGSSAIGVAKAVALSSSLPIIAVPTTYGGSEMTPIWGMTRDGKKETGRDPRVQPKVVIYDSDLTLSLPQLTTAASGMNAMAHCIEALYAPDATPLTSQAACEGLRLLAASLPRLASSPDDREQRADALRGAMQAGWALGLVQMGLHHKLCHVIGGAFDLPHADTHAVMLPYTAAYNRDAAADAMRTAAEVLGVEDTPTELLSIAQTIGAPLSLQSIGFAEADIPRAIDLALEKQYPNPAPVTRERISVLLDAAFRGDSGYVVLP
jgi:alcohol dehydrogenase class IV